MYESTPIASRDNQKLKLVRSVRDGREAGSIFIEGVRLAEEAFRSDLKITDIFISDVAAAKDRIRSVWEKAIGREIRPNLVEEKHFKSIADTENSQGIILLADRPAGSHSQILSKLHSSDQNLKLALLLVEIADPANVGAVLRTAEAAGVAGVIVSRGSADAFSPKAIRSSMGSGFRLPIWENAEFDAVLQWSKMNGLISTAADINTDHSYGEVDWNKPRLMVFGSEAHGLSSEQREKMDETIRIPMENGVESLNLAVSSGIILFEAKRQIARY